MIGKFCSTLFKCELNIASLLLFFISRQALNDHSASRRKALQRQSPAHDCCGMDLRNTMGSLASLQNLGQIRAGYFLIIIIYILQLLHPQLQVCIMY